MMKTVCVFLGLAAFSLTACVSNPEGAKAETTESVGVAAETAGRTLQVDTEQSKVEWRGAKVTGQHHGYVKIKSGSVSVEGGSLTGGQFVIDLTTIEDLDLDGGRKQKLENHLKSADFFDVENHPEANFVITGVKPGASAGQLVISGDLTIRGVTKNITFDATVTESTENAFSANADFNIAREDWGVNYQGKADDLISKEINFKISLVAKG